MSRSRAGLKHGCCWKTVDRMAEGVLPAPDGDGRHADTEEEPSQARNVRAATGVGSFEPLAVGDAAWKRKCREKLLNTHVSTCTKTECLLIQRTELSHGDCPVLGNQRNTASHAGLLEQLDLEERASCQNSPVPHPLISVARETRMVIHNRDHCRCSHLKDKINKNAFPRYTSPVHREHPMMLQIALHRYLQ